MARTGVPFDERFVPDDIYTSYATYQDPVTGFTTNPQTSFEQQALSAKANIHFGEDALLELIGSHSTFDGAFATDADQSPFNVQLVDGVQDVDASTFEARLSGTAGDKFDWTVGAFWYEGEFTNSQQVSIPAFVPTALLVNGQNTTSSENLSGFATRRVPRHRQVLADGGCALFNRPERRSVRQLHRRQTQLDTDESHFDWKAGIDYKFTDTFMAYASAATSYRPQAFNPRPFQVTQFVGVDGEEATSYEIGFKSDLADNRLRVNLAAFYVDYNQRILPIGGTECLADSAGDIRQYRAGGHAGRRAGFAGPVVRRSEWSAASGRHDLAHVLQQHPGDHPGCGVRVPVGADRWPDHQRPVRLHGLPG